MSDSPLFAGVELGGTKCICVLGTGPGDIRAQLRIATRDPQSTLGEAARALDEWEKTLGPVAALGIASFGPLDLRLGSTTYGRILATPKAGWSDTDIARILRRGRAVPVGLNTDVNGAALAEQRWGAAQGLDDLAYVTVGTGVGVGLIVGARPVFGCNHTELGHLRIARVPGDAWSGACQFHGACVEGLASGPAIEARTGFAGADIPTDDPVWEFVAHALGQLLNAIVLATAPRRIVMGGGVLDGRPELLGRVRAALGESLNGYLALDELNAGLSRYVVAPQLGTLAGPLGALALAAAAHAEEMSSPAT